VRAANAPRRTAKYWPKSFKLTPHQQEQAIRRRDQGEPLRETTRTYNLSPEHDFPTNGLIFRSKLDSHGGAIVFQK
jgi:hypothetical protein